MSELVIPKPTIWLPRYASPRNPHGEIPPSPPSEQRTKWRKEILRAVRSYAGRLPEGWHFSRIGTPSSMSGGMQSLTGVETGLYGTAGPPLTGLSHWWKADANVYKDAGTTPAANNDTVAQWNDQIGTLHFSEATNKPTFKTNQQNTHPTIQFDGSNDNLNTANFSQARPYQLFYAAKLVTWASNAFLFGIGPDILGLVCDWGSVSPDGRIIRNSGWLTSNHPDSVFPGSFVVCEVRVPASTTAITVQYNAGSREAMSSSGAVDISSQTFYLANEAGARFCQIQYGEILFYNTVLSDADGDLARAYLNTKWAAY